MSKNREYIQRARKTQEDLVVQLRDKTTDILMHPPKIRTSIARQALINEVWEIFTPYLDDGFTKKLPARLFSHLPLAHSNKTIIKVKKLLGIRSVKTINGWYWKLPLYTPQQAMQRAHTKLLKETLGAEREKLSILSRPAALALMDVMRELHWHGPNTEVLAAMATYGYKSRSTIIQTKSHIGIITRKIDGIYTWLYPHIEVQSWLLDKLRDGKPHLISLLCTEGRMEHQYSPELLTTAMSAAGGIKLRMPTTSNSLAGACWQLFDPARIIEVNHVAATLGLEAITPQAPSPLDPFCIEGTPEFESIDPEDFEGFSDDELNP